MAKENTWGDGVILSAASLCYNRPVKVVSLEQKGSELEHQSHKTDVVIDNDYIKGASPIILGYVQQKHYVSLIPITETTADKQVSTHYAGRLTSICMFYLGILTYL
jgi:hypothetical protein